MLISRTESLLQHNNLTKSGRILQGNVSCQIYKPFKLWSCFFLLPLQPEYSLQNVEKALSHKDLQSISNNGTGVKRICFR